MRTALAAVSVVSLVAAAACGGGSSPTSPGAAASGGFQITGGPLLELGYGETMTLRASHDGSAIDASSVTWTITNTAVATITGSTITATREYGGAIITARTNDGRTATANLWVQPPAHEPSTYRITLVFEDGVHETWREAYRWAAERIQQAIRLELPPFTLTNHTNCAIEGEIPPQSGTETGTRIYVRRALNTNTGFPCVRRPGARPTTVLGTVTTSHASTLDLDSPFTNVRYTAVHEIGHVLGLVGITYGIDHQVTWLDTGTPLSTRYTGTFAREGYRRKFGMTPASLDVRDVHWFGFIGEVLTSPPSGALSPISVGALMDIGYPAAWYGADR